MLNVLGSSLKIGLGKDDGEDNEDVVGATGSLLTPSDRRARDRPDRGDRGIGGLTYSSFFYFLNSKLLLFFGKLLIFDAVVSAFSTLLPNRPATARQL